MNRQLQKFLEKYCLKSGEQLQFVSETGEFFTDIQIIKKTERTLRIVGLLTISNELNQDDSEPPDKELVKAKLTPKKKLHLNDHDSNTIRWFKQGWIMKEIRFKKDGRTPETQHYRMGFRLYQHMQHLQRKKEQEWEQEFNTIKSRFRVIQNTAFYPISKQRQKGIHFVMTIMNEIFIHEASQLQNTAYLPSQWTSQKKMKYLHFLIAFLQLCQQKVEFDWKEIGASYYKEIGGSKQFDPYKDDFIDQLENLAQCPVTILGLTSLGKITPLYFSGQITGQYSSYCFGPVHALTDLSIAQDEYRTEATTLWLVENRAILTRMAAEKDFLQDTNSLLLCIDGHLRSSHKNAIIQLLANSRIEQVILWTDYDQDGLQISKELYDTIIATKASVNVKWITTEHGVFDNWENYQEYMRSFLKIKRTEQEEVLGGVNDWKSWVLR